MPQPRLITRDFLLLCGGQMLQSLGFSSLLLLPVFLDHLGATRKEIGIIQATIVAVTGLLARPLIAWALDRLGRRPTLMAGTVFVSVGMWSLYFVTELGPLLYLTRVLFGIGGAALFAGYFTLAADLIPPSRRTEGIALFGIFGLLPLSLNSVVHRFDVAAETLPTYFASLGGLIFCSLILLYLIKEPDRAARESEAKSGPKPSVFRALVVRELWPVWLATLLFSTLVGTFMAYSTVAAQDRIALTLAPGRSDEALALAAIIWAPYSLGACFVRLFGARLPDRIGPRNLVAPALGIYVLAYVTIATSDQYVLAGLFAGLGHGIAFPVLTSLVVSRADARWRGSAITLYTALGSIPQLLITPALGRLADQRGDAFMFSLTALVCLLVLGLWSLVEHRATLPRAESPAPAPASPDELAPAGATSALVTVPASPARAPLAGAANPGCGNSRAPAPPAG